MGSDSDLLQSPTGQDTIMAAPLSNRSSPTTEGSAGQNMADADLDWFFGDAADMDDFDESGASARAGNRRGLGDEDVRAILATEGLRERERLSGTGAQIVSDGEVRHARRLLTNKRERWRQQLVNEASTNLRQLLPTFPPDKKLSKHDVLRFSGRYIVYLQHQLTDILEQQQLRAGEHPNVAKKNALSSREHQDWQFASMYNHLPLNSVNAATMISATTAYGQATSNLLRERRSTFGRCYPTPGGETSTSPVSLNAPGPGPQNPTPTSSAQPQLAGGFPGPAPQQHRHQQQQAQAPPQQQQQHQQQQQQQQSTTTIPTPVLLTAGNSGTTAARGPDQTDTNTARTAQESRVYPPPTWALPKSGTVPIAPTATMGAMGPPTHHRGAPGFMGAASYSQAMVTPTMAWQ